MIDHPDGIIITIGSNMLKEKGYKNWLLNFLYCMDCDNCIYFMRLGSKPKYDVMYVYLCIGNKIRFRANFIESQGPGEKTFGNETLFGKSWIVLAGPVVTPEKPIEMKGFRGFRYTEKIF